MATYAYISKYRNGKSDKKGIDFINLFFSIKNTKITIVEGAYSIKKPWRKRKELKHLYETAIKGDIIYVSSADILGSDIYDRIDFIHESTKKGIAIYTSRGSAMYVGLDEEAISYIESLKKRLSPFKNKPGRPRKEKEDRPKRRKKRKGRRKGKVGRPPIKRVGRPKKKGTPGPKPAPKKRVSPLQTRFNKQIQTIRSYLRRRFSVKTISEKLDMPYQPLLGLLRKHDTLKKFVKRGR